MTTITTTKIDNANANANANDNDNDTNNNNDINLIEFWLDVKQSMANFYHRYHHINQRPINKWSSVLNSLRADIERHIENYLALYAMDVLRQQCHYHLGILVCNIKRWKALTSSRSSRSSSQTIFLLVDIYQTLTKAGTLPLNQDGHDIFNTIELFLINSCHLETLVTYAIKHNKPGMLDLIRDFCEQQNNCLFDMYIFIEKNYNVKISSRSGGQMCAKKILAHIVAARGDNLNNYNV